MKQIRSRREARARSWRAALAASAVALLLAGCGAGAGRNDYTRDRAIDADINASLDHGPTSAEPGEPAGEWHPDGAAPWQIGQKHD